MILVYSMNKNTIDFDYIIHFFKTYSYVDKLTSKLIIKNQLQVSTQCLTIIKKKQFRSRQINTIKYKNKQDYYLGSRLWKDSATKSLRNSIENKMQDLEHPLLMLKIPFYPRNVGAIICVWVACLFLCYYLLSLQGRFLEGKDV